MKRFVQSLQCLLGWRRPIIPADRDGMDWMVMGTSDATETDRLWLYIETCAEAYSKGEVK